MGTHDTNYLRIGRKRFVGGFLIGIERRVPFGKLGFAVVCPFGVRLPPFERGCQFGQGFARVANDREGLMLGRVKARSVDRDEFCVWREARP